MTIYKITNNKITPIERTTFDKAQIRERQGLQQMLKSEIQIISPDTLIVAEEFGEWEESRRRIDLLAIDKQANLVVIELKRTEDGGHMELQAIRYAAMISTLTFEKLVPIYNRYLRDNNLEGDAEENLLDFLGWSEINNDDFGQDVKIILVSAEFSKELTTAVMWLNDYNLDIRCVRMHPYMNGNDVFLDIQTVIPIPEVADYQISIREKKQKERQSRESSRDYTKFDLEICGKRYESLNKRNLAFQVVSNALHQGLTPQQIIEVAPPERKKILFHVFDGQIDSETAIDRIMDGAVLGVIPKSKRFFCKEGELFFHEGKTYMLSNQWGMSTTLFVDALSRNFPELKIKLKSL